MSIDDNCQIVDNCSKEPIGDNCSNGTCAPVSPFSKEGFLFLIFIVFLLAILFAVLYFNNLFF